MKKIGFIFLLCAVSSLVLVMSSQVLAQLKNKATDDGSSNKGYNKPKTKGPGTHPEPQPESFV